MTPINENAPVKAKESIQIEASPEKVWQILSDINNWNKWNSDIQFAKINGELKAGTTFNWNSMGTKIMSTLHTVTPLHEIGWSGRTFGAFAIHNFKITAENGYTTVLIEESMEGFLMRLFRGYMQNTLENAINKWLTQIKEAAEMDAAN
ncbi:MAG: SRPBCC family protein [Fermentimonas sp.]|nr:SRPBCC family protein [Fermentimonas sp.]